jgi:hypothetical protein
MSRRNVFPSYATLRRKVFNQVSSDLEMLKGPINNDNENIADLVLLDQHQLSYDTVVTVADNDVVLAAISNHYILDNTFDNAHTAVNDIDEGNELETDTFDTAFDASIQFQTEVESLSAVITYIT